MKAAWQRYEAMESERYTLFETARALTETTPKWAPRYQPAGSPLFLSAPSTTMGCQSGASPFYWRLEVGEEGLGSIKEVRIEALAAVGASTSDSA